MQVPQKEEIAVNTLPVILVILDHRLSGIMASDSNVFQFYEVTLAINLEVIMPQVSGKKVS